MMKKESKPRVILLDTEVCEEMARAAQQSYEFSEGRWWLCSFGLLRRALREEEVSSRVAGGGSCVASGAEPSAFCGDWSRGGRSTLVG